MTTRRTVMRAFGQYLDYAEHFAGIKRGEAQGDPGDFSRAVTRCEQEYQDKVNEFLGFDNDKENGL